MRAIVTEVFIDKNNNSVVYNVGDTVDFDEKRIEDLSARKLVKVLDEPKEEPKKRATRKK